MVIHQVRAALSRRNVVLAKAAALWATLRQTIEEKIEPMMAEPLEIATHIAPQLAALA